MVHLGGSRGWGVRVGVGLGGKGAGVTEVRVKPSGSQSVRDLDFGHHLFHFVVIV